MGNCALLERKHCILKWYYLAITFRMKCRRKWQRCTHTHTHTSISEHKRIWHFAFSIRKIFWYVELVLMFVFFVTRFDQKFHFANSWVCVFFSLLFFPRPLVLNVTLRFWFIEHSVMLSFWTLNSRFDRHMIKNTVYLTFSFVAPNKLCAFVFSVP